MRQKFGILALLAGVALGAAACSQRLPLEEAAPTTADEGYSAQSSPLDLRVFEVVASGGGYRGVFLKLSRFPDSVTTTDFDDPARIVLDIRGPTGVESPEESFSGGDSIVSVVRVSREMGMLRIILDLAGNHTPEYTVHRMADWIMIRIRPKS